MYYLVRLQHHTIEEEFGTIGCNDPYDHYIGDIHTRTNLRFVIVDDKELESLMDAYIPDDPFNYESVEVICEFRYDHELRRFLECMENVTVIFDTNGVKRNETL